MTLPASRPLPNQTLGSCSSGRSARTRSEHYANALAVPFVPYDEDYGYITIEAMLSGKPVVTTLDAGGPTEFVIDGKTGRVVAPEARRWGRYWMRSCVTAAARSWVSAAAQVSGISWSAVERALLGETASRAAVAQPARAQGRRRICGFSTFPVSPARGGGQQRVLNICRELSRTYDVEIISFVEAAEAGGTTELNPACAKPVFRSRRSRLSKKASEC